MNRYFSKASVLRLEPMIQKYVDSLVRRLSSYEDIKKPVNLSWAFSCFTNDVISEYALGKSSNYVEESKDFHTDFHDAMENTSKIGHVTKVFPWILPLMQNMPTEVLKLLDPKIESLVDFQQVSVVSSCPLAFC
jgi:cytochrome P450